MVTILLPLVLLSAGALADDQKLVVYFPHWASAHNYEVSDVPATELDVVISGCTLRPLR